MLIDTIRQTIQAHDLIHKDDHIVLGLSGGPDSVCLFHVLLRLAAEYDLTIHPVHVNHQFRPGDAERDQAYVEALCQNAANNRAGVHPCRTFVVDCNALAQEQGLTSEEAGRQARYDAFVQVAREAARGPAGEAAQELAREPAGKVTSNHEENSDVPSSVRIAVAQNANDQAETILHRILRGTGTDGLSGIAYERSERGIPVIRPLLDVPRNEIEAYCAENQLDPVIDHTNNEPIYMRNRIRLELLPELARYNENIIDTLTRLGRIAAADKEYLWQQTETEYARLREPVQPLHEIVLDRAGLAELPEAIRHRVITRAFRDAGLVSDISEERLRAADSIIMKKQAPKTVQFPRGYQLTVKKGKVYFRLPLSK